MVFSDFFQKFLSSRRFWHVRTPVIVWKGILEYQVNISLDLFLFWKHQRKVFVEEKWRICDVVAKYFVSFTLDKVLWKVAGMGGESSTSLIGSNYGFQEIVEILYLVLEFEERINFGLNQIIVMVKWLCLM